jgi:hypothetical protein
MWKSILIGIGAGAASALLSLSLVSGSPISLLLVFIASLPILIVTIGWSGSVGLIAVAAAAIGLGLIVDWRLPLSYVVSVGAPAWWLGYLAMLARPAEVPEDAEQSGEQPPAPAALEWYPVGRLVVWTAILGAAGIVILVPYLGFDKQTFDATLREFFQRMLRAQPGPDGTLQIPNVRNPKALLDILVLAAPPAAALGGTIMFMANLWLAGRIALMSGRLRRPWPDIPSMELPVAAAGIVAAALAASFLPDILGLIGGVIAAAMLIAYGVYGLAVVHAITRGLSGRVVILGVIYAVLLLQGWPILILSLVGLIDTAVDIRGRVARWRGKPTNIQS